MTELETKLFTHDADWLSETYKTTEEAFVVTEYFARYVRKRWPKGKDDPPFSDRGHLYLELIDVDFWPPEEVPRKLIRLGFASDTLKIILPDQGYTEEEKETLRDFYQQKYTPIIKESHARTNALLWHTFSNNEKNEILSIFNKSSELQVEIKRAIRRELYCEPPLKETEALKIQPYSQSGVGQAAHKDAKGKNNKKQ